jgi:hypothetical protein
MFQNKSVWFNALRDILVVRPLPRLQYALPSMTRAELMEACVRAYRLERVFGHSTHDVAVRRQIPLIEWIYPRSAWIVPGGKYYILFEDEGRKLGLYDVDIGNKVMDVFHIASPPQGSLAMRPRIVPVSSESFLLAHLDHVDR